MALDREREVGARHAGAVVGDADQAPPAAVGHDLDAACAGVERVLDQFLDHARRPLDHLAGGDAVDGGFGKLADGHAVRTDSGSARIYHRRNAAAARRDRRNCPRYSTEYAMLSPTALLWTLDHRRRGLADRRRPDLRDVDDAALQVLAPCLVGLVQGRITQRLSKRRATRPRIRSARRRRSIRGIVIRYRYRVGDKDYEGDGVRASAVSRAPCGLLAKALLQAIPEGRDVEVFYDPANQATSCAASRRARTRCSQTIVFFVVSHRSPASSRAHAIAEHDLNMMSNGLSAASR